MQLPIVVQLTVNYFEITLAIREATVAPAAPRIPLVTDFVKTGFVDNSRL